MKTHVGIQNIFNLTSSSLRIGGVIIFFVGASIMFPRIVDAAHSLHYVVHSYSVTAVPSRVDEHKLKNQNSFNAYEPPDFGRPASAYGSGTR